MHWLRRAFSSVRARLVPLWLIQRPEGGAARIRITYPVALVAFGLVLVWYVARPSAVAVVAVVGLGGLLGCGYFYARRMAHNLFARRRLNYAAIQVGDEIEETVVLSNRSAFPALWIEFADHSNIPGYSLTSVRAAGGHETFDWRVHATCTQRGNYHFGPWEMLTSDPFGLFKVTIAYDQKEEILVYPPLAALPAEILPHGRSQGDDRPLAQPLAAESLSALATRPYAPGDPLRRIHWPTTARRDAPYVKIFDPEASSTLWLIPDLDSAVQRGSGADSTLETMITLLASLANRLLDERMAVGLIAYAQSPQLVLPARDRPHLWQILRLLAGLETGPHPFAETLAQARTVISGRQRVVVVTPSLQPAWAGELQRLGSTSRRSGAEVILLDPNSFGSENIASTGPFVGARGNEEHQNQSRNPRAPVKDEPLNNADRGRANADRARGFEERQDTSQLPRAPTNGADESGAFVTYLASLGIPARVLRQGDIQPFSASYGELSRWEFKTLGTGRVLARHSPHRKAGVTPPGAR